MINTLRGLPAHTRAFIILAVMAVAIFSLIRAASAVVTDQVRRDTPIALDGEVWSVEEVGNTIVVAGNLSLIHI